MKKVNKGQLDSLVDVLPLCRLIFFPLCRLENCTLHKKSCTQVTQNKQLLKRKRNIIKTISTF